MIAALATTAACGGGRKRRFSSGRKEPEAVQLRLQARCSDNLQGVELKLELSRSSLEKVFFKGLR